METRDDEALTKVPEVTLLFWIIKIAATTLGETGGDAVSMSMGLGYIAATGIFALLFLLMVALQVATRRFNAWCYWTTIIATTTLGTTLADYADRTLGIGYLGGSLLLFALLGATLALWYRSTGSIAVDSVASRKAESFYWVTILFSQTLGTALGDWTADTAATGYAGAAVIFAALLALIVAAYFRSSISRTVLFWAAFVVTRPLGAVTGDLLDKPLAEGGLALSRYSASAALLLFITACLLLSRQRAASRQH